MKRILLFASILICIVSLSCKEETFLSMGDLLVDPTIQPKIIHSFPPLNSKGPYEGFDEYSPKLTLRFNKIMEKESILKSLRISSNNRSWHISESYQNIPGEIFSFIASNSYGHLIYSAELFEVITLEFMEPVVDYNGNSIPPGIIGTWEPEPHFRLRSTEPKEGQSLSEYNQTVRLWFNSPIDSNIIRHIRITPPLDGVWTKPSFDSYSVYFKHTNIIESKTYELTVSKDASDIYGNRMGADQKYIFASEEFGMRYSYPVYINHMLQDILLVFTSPVDTTSIRNAIHVVPPLSYSLEPALGNYQAISFTPEEEYHPSTRYSITVDTTLRSGQGVPLARNKVISFLAPSFRVTSTTPLYSDTAVSRKSFIYVNFNSVLDTSTVRRSFGILPMVPGVFYLQGLESFYFYPSDSLAPLQTYRVTIDTSVGSIGGWKLSAPHVFSFKTGR